MKMLRYFTIVVRRTLHTATRQTEEWFFRTLTEEFSLCCRDEAHLDKRHDAGQDAYKCARLFLHYNEACVVATIDCEVETRDTKKAKSAATTV